MRYFRTLLAIAILTLAPKLGALAQQAAADTPQSSAGLSDESSRQTSATDLLALMTGKCSTLRVAGRDFACRAVAFVHSVKGRVNFTIALDDSDDQYHIIAFSGENAQRTGENLYDLIVDRMVLNSNDQPKADGLPIPAVVTSQGRCVQLGNFATAHVSSVVCSAIDKGGNRYELRFESDGSPITVRRINPSAPTIRQNS